MRDHCLLGQHIDTLEVPSRRSNRSCKNDTITNPLGEYPALVSAMFLNFGNPLLVGLPKIADVKVVGVMSRIRDSDFGWIVKPNGHLLLLASQ